MYFSYRQTIEAYPSGGGSYTVARFNLGTFWGLLAAAALLATGSTGLSPDGGRFQPVAFRVTLLVALVLAPLHARESRKSMQVFRSAELPTTETIAQLSRVRPVLPRGAHVFFERDPFPPHDYSLLFLVRLYYDDLTIDVARAKDGDSPYGRHFDAVLSFP